MRFHSILCPVDFSEHSRRAFEYALAIAAEHRARLTILTVIDPLLAQAASATHDQDYVRDTRAELSTFVGEPSLRHITWAPAPRLVVSIGAAGDEILDAAEFHEVDLIVMGMQGLGGGRRLVFGSTTERVLRRTTAPVLATPLGLASLVSLERTGPQFRIPGIVTGVDFRGGTTALARLAAGLAGEVGASLILAHVVQPVQGTSRWRDSLHAANSLHRATAQAAMEQLAAALDPGVAVEAVTLTGYPADALSALAAERGARLIVIGTGSGENGSHRPGSTVYRVLCLAQLPVLAVPATSADRIDTERRTAGDHARAWPSGTVARGPLPTSGEPGSAAPGAPPALPAGEAHSGAPLSGTSSIRRAGAWPRSPFVAQRSHGSHRGVSFETSHRILVGSHDGPQKLP